MSKYVEFEKWGGDLRIRLLDEGREQIKEMREKDISPEVQLYELFEWQSANGWERIWPEEIGALTDAPILSDEGIGGRVYWWPQYETTDPVAELERKGAIIFQGAE